jgi:5'-3' exoribonuclease 1
VQWDEYDEQDVNLVTWRFPRAVDDGKGKPESEKEAEEVVEDGAEGNNDEWEDEEEEDEEEEDAESRAAVDRVLKKYEKAPVEDLDAQGTFDERYERSVKEKMDEWKRGYYQVCFSLALCMYSIKICVLILG